MKKSILNKKLLAILVFVCIAVSASSKNRWGDTIFVDYSQGIRLIIVTPKPESLKNLQLIDFNKYSSLLLQNRQMLPDTLVDPYSSFIVNFRIEGLNADGFTIEKKEPRRQVFNISGENSLSRLKASADTLIFLVRPGSKVIIVTGSLTRNLDQIAQMDINAIIRRLNEVKTSKEFENNGEVKYERKKGINLWYEYQKDTLNFIKYQNLVRSSLELNMVSGVSVIRSQIVPDLKVNMSFRRAKGLNYPVFGVSAQMHYFFERRADRSFQLYPNTFIGVFSNNFISSLYNTESSYFTSLTYLIQSRGEYFGKNTFKLTMGHTSKSQLSFSGDIFISNNFKSFFPGFRVGLGF